MGLEKPADRCVLIIEDDEDVLEVLVYLLKSEGHRAVGVTGADAALALLRDGLRPSLILLDLVMPVRDGWSFREEQLRDPHLASIPTVVLSGVEGIESPPGVAASLTKPVDFKNLLELVRRYV